MLDITPYLELKPAPHAVFDALEQRRDKPRFMVPTGDGEYRAVTWGEYAAAIRRTALYLVAAGFKPGERACVFSANRVEWMVAALAIQAAGGVMVPIYPASTPEQVAYIIQHSDARFVFADKPVDAEHVVGMDDMHALPADESRDFQALLDAVNLDAPGMMLYTSGTTGNPKGVPLTHRNVGVNGRDWLRCNAPLLDDQSVDLLWLPMSHIFGFGEACLGNTLGFTTYLSDPASALRELPRVRPNVFMSVPAYWEKLAVQALVRQAIRRRSSRELTGGRLKFCLSGGAGLKREVKELFHRSGLLIIEGYGLSECSPTLTLNRPDAFRFDSVGKPLPSVELKLAEDGEILARGESVFSGYHKDPDATREAFTEDGWLKTGDVGRFTDDGFLQIIDRKKEILVTSGGKNVPPANIELRFADDPLISHLVVYGDGKKYLVAGVWLDHQVADAERAVQERIDRVNAGLAHHEQVKRFRIMDRPLTVDGGLVTSTLKLRRKKIYEAFHDQFEALYA